MPLTFTNFDGIDGVVADFRRTEEKTTNYTVTAADTGKTFTVPRGTVIFSLPATSVGLVYTFASTGDDGTVQIQVSPVAADGIAAAGSAVVNKDLIFAAATTKKGDYVKIISGYGATGVTAWHVVDHHGILTKEP